MSVIEPIYVVLILSIITLLYNVKRNNQIDRRNPDQQLINFLSKIKINRKKIIEISNQKREDKLQIFIDEIIISYDNQKVHLFKKLIHIYDSKWNGAFKNSSRISNQSRITEYFCEHYRYLIIELIKRQADYKSIYPILKSFSDNGNLLLDSLKNDKETYKKEKVFILNQYFLFANESIDNENDAIFRECLEMWLESFKMSIKQNCDDFYIFMYYIHQFEPLTQSACETNDDVSYMSSILKSAGEELLSKKYFMSFKSILDIFEDIITLRFNSYTEYLQESEVDLINHDLMFAERILLYFMSNTQFNLPAKCYTKIENILIKNISNNFYKTTLHYAVEKTSEWFRNDSESNKNLSEIANRLFGKSMY